MDELLRLDSLKILVRFQILDPTWQRKINVNGHGKKLYKKQLQIWYKCLNGK